MNAQRARIAASGELHPVLVLLLASGAAAVGVTLVNVTVLAATGDFALLRDLALFTALLGWPGAPRWPFESLLGSPLAARVLTHPFSLYDPSSALVFLALSTAATLCLYWGVALLGSPIVLAVARLVRRDGTRGRWLWTQAYPLGAFVAFSTPAVFVIVHAALSAGSGLRTVAAVSLPTALLAWFLLTVWLRRPERVCRFLQRAATAGGVTAVLIWSGAALALAVGRERPAPSAAVRRPNILLVSIDSLRSDHVHAYGYPRETTPTLDGLAREGVRFHTVVSPTSWTLPAHLTLLTALPPERHGVVADGQRLRADALFLQKVLWQAGYTTAGFVCAPYLDAAYGFSQGFDHYDDYSIAKWSFEASYRGATSPRLLGLVSDWLAGWDTAGRQRPFFIFLHMWDVHYDYTPPPPYDTMFDPDYRGSVTGEDFELGTQVHPGMAARDLAHVIALYDGEIRYTDHYLGLVLERLRALGVLDQTIVVVTADHGDEFLEHGRKGHKQALYDESILVPLIIRYPDKVPAGRVVTEQVRLMDVGPTIVALAGLPRPPDFGVAAAVGPYAALDLGPWITAPPDRRPHALPAFSDLVGDAPVPIASVRTPEFKLIQEQGDGSHEELYALSTDPGEHTNLLPGTVSAASPLRQELSDWRSNWSDTRLAAAAALDAEHQERLRALGYLKK